MFRRSAGRLVGWLLACAAGTVLVAQSSPTGQPPRFRSAIDIVAVDVTVLSRGGDPVTTLGLPDFELTVDGAPRRIQSVQLVRSDERTSTPPANAAAASASRATPAVAPSPRRFVLVIDRAHTPVGEGQSMLEAAATFVDSLPIDDQVAFWTTPDPPSALRFLESRDEIERRIRLAVGTYRPPIGPWKVGRDEAISAVERGLTSGGGAESQLMPGTLAAIVARECYKQLPTCPVEVRNQVIEVAADARQRADATLADMRALIDALASVEGPKHVILVTGGPVLTADNRTVLASLGAHAALARVTVHALQVHQAPYQARTDSMRMEPEEIDQGQSASVALATTTGGLALTPVSGEIGFKRLARELSAAYLLVFETQDADRDGRLHQIDVKVRGAGWGTSVRARKTFRIDPNAAARANASAGPVAGGPAPAAAPVPAEPVGTDPGRMAERLADWLERYERELAAIVAEERFVQIIYPWWGIPKGPDAEPALRWVEAGAAHAPAPHIIARRQLQSDVLLVQVKGQPWQSYRDVAEVDGRPVRDRTDRVQRLFLSGSGDLASRFHDIALESARYNLGNIIREVNLPTVTLSLLRRVNHPRFQFKRQKDEAIDGRPCRVLAYRETRRPTLISTRHSLDMFIYGRVWLDQQDGSIRRTELGFDRTYEMRGSMGALRSSIRVDYGHVDGFDILLPQRMWEWYEGVNLTGRINQELTGAQGLATYAKYRRFQVSTSEAVKQ